MEIPHQTFETKAAQYKFLQDRFLDFLRETSDQQAILANTAALLYHYLEDVNWAGFYRWKHGKLVLGAFQGKPAVPEIPLGSGVCGTAAEQQSTQRIEDVSACPYHIACDSSSRSEIVVPIRGNGRLFGVIDIDSPLRGRFQEADQQGLEQLANLLGSYLAGTL